MFSASKSGKVAAAAPDAQFNYVTALLHGDGTNGAQNNTFLDSSTNNFTITRNGTPTQGSFSPYGTLWSIYFNGSTDVLTTPASSNINWGTNNFTFETWIYCTTTPTASGATLIATNESYSIAGAWALQLSTGLVFAWYEGPTQKNTSNTISLNTWNHIAVTRNGTSLQMWLNGVLQGTSSSSYSYGTSSVGLSVGYQSSYSSAYYNGYLSNSRLVTNSAVYTSAFTPPTSPLTAISGTQLLICQSNRFIDNSSNAFALTVGAGTPSVQRFNPFLPTSSQAYSTSVYGGSAYFTGSGDYLGTTTSSSGFTFGTGDFTIEMWVNWSQFANAPSNEPGVFQTSTTSGGLQTTYLDGVLLFITSGYFNVICGTTFAGRLTSNSAPNFNTWYHVAIVRSSGTLTIYVNGVNAGSQSNTSNLTATYAAIGGYYSSSYSMNGYVSNFRVVKGTAVYTANFTPPTSPLTAITNTSLLVNMTNAGIYDNAMMNDWLTVGSAQVSTSVKKYGTGSVSIPTSSYLQSENQANIYAFGTGDFTIECWVYCNSFSTVNWIYDGRPISTNGIQPTILISTSGVLSYFTNVAYQIQAGTLTTGAWYHVAYCRASGTGRLFLSGTVTGSFSDTYSYTNTVGRPVIGTDGYAVSSFSNCYIDDFRVSNYARYTANFTPPTAALPNYGR